MNLSTAVAIIASIVAVSSTTVAIMQTVRVHVYKRSLHSLHERATQTLNRFADVLTEEQNAEVAEKLQKDLQFYEITDRL